LTVVVFYRQAPSASWGYDVHVDSLWAATPAARLGLLGFLGGHSMQVRTTTLTGGAAAFDHDLLWLLDEQDVRSEGGLAWMQRIVDPAAALSARGWSGRA